MGPLCGRQIFTIAGENAKALAAYQQALKLDAANSTAKQGVQRLGGE